MKSNPASPQSNIVRLRTIRLTSDSGMLDAFSFVAPYYPVAAFGQQTREISVPTPSFPGSPKVRLDELFPTTMNGSGGDDSSLDDASHVHNSISKSPSPKIQAVYETPVSRQFRNTDQLSTPAPTPSSLMISPSVPLRSPRLVSQPPTPGSDVDGYSWSSAVGRATTGKSGRVIERLMADVDRLQREKHLANVKLEEETKRSESARSILDNLQISNQHLESSHEVDKLALGKRDRKIEELRADLQVERSRREKAEADMKDTRLERDETVQDYQRQILDERDKAKRSTTQYEILSKSWKNLEDKYERQTRKLKEDVKELKQQMISDRGKLMRLGVIMEQLKQEGDKTRKAKDKVLHEFEAFREQQEQGIHEMRSRAERNDAASDEALRQLDTVLGEMRYVVNVKKDVRDAG